MNSVRSLNYNLRKCLELVLLTVLGKLVRVPNDNLSLLVADYAHSGQGRNQTTPVTTETGETLTKRRGFTTRAETPPDGAQSSTKRTQTLAVLLNGRSSDGSLITRNV
jgi:hypothetical protein